MEEDEKNKIEESEEDNENSDEVEEQIELNTAQIENLAGMFRTTTKSSTLKQAAEAQEHTPMNLEESVADVWVNEEKPDKKTEYSISYDELAKSYDDARAVNVKDNPNVIIKSVQSIDMDTTHIGRGPHVFEPMAASADMINPELREMRGRGGSLDRDYVVHGGGDVKEFKTHSPFEQQHKEYEIK